MKKLFLFALALAMTANVLAQFNPQTTPLTLEARDANTQVKVLNNNGGTFSYKINGTGALQTIANTAEVTIDLPNVGDYVQLWGDQATTCKNGQPSRIGVESGFAYLYGNVMSLVQNGASSFADLTQLQGDSTFLKLFYQAPSLDIHPNKDLVLPATTLRDYCYDNMFRECTDLTKAPALPAETATMYCYRSMFYGCTSLTQAPELPATTLNSYCYAHMFRNCTSLTAAPELPATTMAPNCYIYMFAYCSGLTQAPELPATTLASYCYWQLFRNCTGLTEAPALPATTMAVGCYRCLFEGCTGLTQAPELPATQLNVYCYEFMFDSCSNLTIAPELPATTLAAACYSRMFKACTSLTQAPVLPAATLVNQCYFSMFNGCTNLNEITCLATDISATKCTETWLENVAATGTFIKAKGFTGWTTNSADGIPEGWTAEEKLPAPIIHYNKSEVIDTASISISCVTEGASIYYTTDGTTPSNTNGTLYTTPIFVNVTAANENTDLTLKAIVIKNDEVSAVRSSTYTLKRTVCQFELSPNDYSLGSVSMPATAKYGDEVTITATPIEGYKVGRIYVSALGEISGNTFIVPARWSAMEVYVFFVKQSFKVTFVDYDDSVLKEEEVLWMEAATAPADPTREGYTFAGWDKDFSSITAATTVKATYTINTYRVTVVAEYGTVTAMDADNNPIDLSQPVEYGKVIFLTATPDEGYAFSSWENYDAETGLTVTADVTVTAIFAQSTTEGFESIRTSENAAKVLRDGRLLILRGDKTYTMTGQEVK